MSQDQGLVARVQVPLLGEPGTCANCGDPGRLLRRGFCIECLLDDPEPVGWSMAEADAFRRSWGTTELTRVARETELQTFPLDAARCARVRLAIGAMPQPRVYDPSCRP